jgi:serine-type D-Ala-D-Ala carboxypeptidase (penicillin-binding protein 5/6)
MASKDFRKGTGNLLPLLLVSFLYISLTAIVLNLGYLRPGKNIDVKGKATLGASVEISEVNNLTYPQFLSGSLIELDARSAFAIDIDTGAVLYDKNSLEAAMPASTSKVITALVAFDAYNLDQKLLVPKVAVEGTKIGLTEGEEITVKDLLYALLVSSANDAAEVLAYNYPGGREMFVASMNLKAQSLGLENSLFLNPTGLDEEDQTTTAQDLVKASFYAMQNPTFATIVGTKHYSIINTDGQVTHNLTNINKLLWEVEGVKGVKTGKTDGARENLLTYIERGDAKVMIAILGSSDRFEETKKLVDWIFSSYSFQ